MNHSKHIYVVISITMSSFENLVDYVRNPANAIHTKITHPWRTYYTCISSNDKKEWACIEGIAFDDSFILSSTNTNVSCKTIHVCKLAPRLLKEWNLYKKYPKHIVYSYEEILSLPD
jgi:hypothetical protein